MRRRQREKLLKQALAKREVLNANSLPNVYLYKRFYRKCERPTLTRGEKKVHAIFEAKAIRITEGIMKELMAESN